MAGATTMQGRCHCGAVRFEADLVDGFTTIRRCTCSLCRMRGAVAVSARLGGVRLLAGEETIRSYRFNTATAEHFFCGICGIYTHHQRRSNPDEYGVNVACLDGVSPFDFAEVPVLDGEGTRPTPAAKPGAPARCGSSAQTRPDRHS